MSVLGCGLIYAAAVLVANRQGLTTDDTAFTLLLVPACLLLGIGAGMDRIVGDRDRPEGMLFGLLTASTVTAWHWPHRA
jgi:hypothetical protein